MKRWRIERLNKNLTKLDEVTKKPKSPVEEAF